MENIIQLNMGLSKHVKKWHSEIVVAAKPTFRDH